MEGACSMARFGRADATRNPRPSRPHPGLNETVERLFRHHPLGLPLTCLVIGGLLVAVQWQSYGHAGGRGLAVSFLFLIVGLASLPFGVATTIRRRRNAIVLICPRCHAESRSSARPFSVQRWNDVNYAYVVCSDCGADFTVDKFATLL